MAPNPISWCRRSRKPPAASGPRRLLSSAQQTRLRALPLGELETFADTRLDVHGPDDLNAWLTVDDFTSSVANREIFGLGRQTEAVGISLRLLEHRCGSLTPKQQARIQALSLRALETLLVALLDFQGPEDLTAWLSRHAS